MGEVTKSNVMRWGKHITRYLAAVALAIAVVTPLPCAAQKSTAHVAAPAPHAPYQIGARPAQQGHAGDWLRRYKDLSPQEQERALQNDPGFRRLPPARQQLLRLRLQHFSNLPPQRQLQILNRMETWEHLTSTQQQQARQIFSQMRQLPPERQRMVTTAVRDLRAMPPDQREQVINSPRFRGMFSDQEREMMRGATRLPLAPAEGGEGGPQE